MPRTALVVGASGLVGGHCLTTLLEDPDYGHVTTLGRRPTSFQHPRLLQHVIDFDQPDTYRHLCGVQDVFCCLGTTIKKAGSREAFYKVDFEYPEAIAKAASALGAEQFLIVSAVGANPRAPAFYSRVKGQIEQAVGRLPFRAVQIFRPSLLIGHRTESRPAEHLALVVGVPLSFALVGPLRRYRPIAASAVAACMVRSAKRGFTGIRVIESDQIETCESRGESGATLSPS